MTKAFQVNGFDVCADGYDRLVLRNEVVLVNHFGAFDTFEGNRDAIIAEIDPSSELTEWEFAEATRTVARFFLENEDRIKDVLEYAVDCNRRDNFDDVGDDLTPAVNFYFYLSIVEFDEAWAA